MGRRGFSLVEMAVVVAIMAILAGMMAPMALKALGRHREAATRESLKLAFEAMFGARDRRVANMRADFGFEPGQRDYPDLPFLVNREAWGEVPAFGAREGATFPWGWNGPYWQGPVQKGNPVDAWGNPIGLVFRHGGWQVHSPGPDRRGGGADDLYYPPVPMPPEAFRVTVLLVINREGPSIAGTVALRYGGNRSKDLATTPAQPIHATASPQTFTFTAPAGAMRLEFQPADGASFKAFALPMDILPGQTREIEVRL